MIPKELRARFPNKDDIPDRDSGNPFTLASYSSGNLTIDLVKGSLNTTPDQIAEFSFPNP